MLETKQKYGVIKATQLLPVRDLLVVPHRDKALIVSHPAFGPDSFSANTKEMKRLYTHSQDFPQITFREPTTSESISAVAYEFEKRAKPEIFDEKWLHAGWILRTSEGVFVNFPRDKNGNLILDESELKKQVGKARKIEVGKGHIYLGANDFGFAEYESFQRGFQDRDTFAQGGLAKVIESTNKRFAPKLREIASPRNYGKGVDIWGFDPTSDLTKGVLTLGSGKSLGNCRLVVGGDWDGGGHCCSFGVLDVSTEDFNS